MKLMKNVANRGHSPTRPPAKPCGPSVAGGRSSKMRIVIAMAKTPSIRVSRRFFGSPRAFGLGAPARLPPDPATWSRTLKHRRWRFARTRPRGRTAGGPHRGSHRVDETRVRVRRVRAFELKTSLRSECPSLDVHVVQDFQMVRDESERNHEHGLLTGLSDLLQDFLKRRSEPCLVSSARTLPRHSSSERRQSTEHEGHRLGQFPFIRVPSVDEFLREAVGGEHDDRIVETPLCEELETLPDLRREHAD